MKKLTAILLSCLLLLSLCACGSSPAQKSAAYDSSYAVSAPAEAYGGFRDAYANDEAMLYAEEAEFESPAEPVPAPDAPAGGAAQELNPEKIIYSASVNVETTEFDESLAKLDALVKRYGGFVESSSLSGNNYYAQSRGYASNRSASYVLRIPCDRFSELMSSLSELGNVPYTYTYTENITAQYYDVDARLNACRTQEERLLEMMEKAETVSDLIIIEERLSELRYQIESLQSTLKNWDRQVSYSCINLSLQEVSVYTPQEEPGFWRELWESVKDGFYNAGELLKDLLQLIVTLLPLIVIAAVVLLLFLPRIKKRRAAKKVKKEASQQSAE